MKKTSVALLAVIAAAMLNEAAPYHMATAKEAEELVKEGFAEQNQTIAEGDKFATRLTEKGQAANMELNPQTPAAPEAPAAAVAAPGGFTIESGIPLPSPRGGKNGSVYPFEQLGVGQSFFVGATTDKPNPAKSLASTVSSATKRYEGESPARKFVVRSVDETAQGRGKGARVFRTV